MKVVCDTFVCSDDDTLICLFGCHLFRFEAGEKRICGLIARGNDDMVDILENPPIGQMHRARDRCARCFRSRGETLSLVELERFQTRHPLRVGRQEGLVEVEFAAARGLVALVGQPIKLLGNVKRRDARADEEHVLVLVMVRVSIALRMPHPVRVLPLPLSEARNFRDERDVVVARGDDNGVERPVLVLEGVLAVVLLQECLGAHIPLPGGCIFDGFLDTSVIQRHVVGASLL